MKLRSTRLARFDSLFVPSPYLVSSRHIHNSKPDRASLVAASPVGDASSKPLAYTRPSAPTGPSLSCLPLSQVARTYLITCVSSSPTLLQSCSYVLSRMVKSKSALLNVERNPILKYMLRETFYKQFCAGENKAEIQVTSKQLHSLGYTGVVLEYSLEVLADADTSDTAKDVQVWRNSMLQSVEVLGNGDMVGLKWSGMGPHALQLLKQMQPPTPLMDSAMRAVCDAAAAKGVRLLPAAEESNTTPCVDAWSLNLQKHYNREGKLVVYNTYQAYLQSCPATISKHLAEAKKEGYTLGLKLVRGAYLGSEPEGVIWPSIEATHHSYDSITESLLTRTYTDFLKPLNSTETSFPDVDVVLATHNAASVRKAQAIRTRQVRNKEDLIPLAYAQLQGMADEVSCELIQAAKAAKADEKTLDIPRAYKLAAWGTMTECLGYLLRRASENKDAASRTKESRVAMGQELRRRFRAMFGFA